MSDYTIKDIESLSFKEGVRKRVGMYLGSATNQGVLQAIYEIITNSIDEFLMGYGKTIEIGLGEGNLITITDHGRGVPFGIKEDGSNVLVDIFTKSHTGGKFKDSAYVSVAGLNGIGAKGACLSALKFGVSVSREGRAAQAHFEKGDLISYEEHETSQSWQGTSIQFIPDPEVFSEEEIKIDFEEIKRTCEDWSYLNKGLSFILTDIDGTKTTYLSKKGLEDLLGKYAKRPLHPTPIHYSKKIGNTSIELILQWTADKEQTFTYTNGLLNPEGGTSLTGVKTAITRTLKKALKGEVDADTIRNGLVLAISCSLPNPSFANQTKSKVTNQELRSLCDRVFVEAFEKYQKENGEELKKIFEIIQREHRAEQAAIRARESILKQERSIIAAQSKKIKLPSKLNDCVEHGENSHLYIVEGDSAKGSLIGARDFNTQAIYCLRGKIINALRNPMEDILENQEVADIITALGCGIQEKYNAKKLNYGKIIVAVDGDAK